MATRKTNQPGGVYERLRTDILRLAIRPGEDIDETALAERYGTSRTPVREALIRLASDGLVQFSPKRGARVTALILPDLPRFMEAMDLNRRAACRLAALRRWDEEIIKIRQAYEDFVRVGRGEKVGTDSLSGEVADHEMKLYLQIAVAGHNSYVTEAFSRLLTVGLRMMRLPFAYSPRDGQTVHAYLDTLFTVFGNLVDCIVEQDAAGAETCAAELHVVLVKRLREFNEENLLSSVSAPLASDTGVGALLSKAE
ncbi:MAG: GntR family transcriptional regulator [Hyphomicrobiales bacterium]|nr:GntR family transcriptional regulator [Hyphomicrobiales bacterium]